MNAKRITSAVLALSVAFGMAGCVKAGARKEIEDVLTQYEKALRYFNPKKVRRLTSWDDDSSEYEWLEECFELNGNGIYIIEVYETTASTISVNYDASKIKAKKGSAVVEVEYELVNWEALYDQASRTASDLCNSIRASKDTITVEGEISLELVDGEWVITEITDLDEVLAFTKDFPDIETPQWPTIPTVFTDPTDDTEDPVDTSVIADAYLSVMESYEMYIKGVEETFGLNSCGINDFNRDGVQELFFLCGEDEEIRSAGFVMYQYDTSTGGPVQTLYHPMIINSEVDGSSFMVFWTIYGELAVVQSYKEETGCRTVIQIYAQEYEGLWTLLYTYEHVVSYSLDPDDQEHSFYFDGDEVGEDSFRAAFSTFVDAVGFVIYNDLDLEPDDLMYPLMSEIRMETYSYDEMTDILNSET